MLHPDLLLKQITSRQFAEWVAYFKEHPFGQDYEHMMLAQVACILANANRAANSRAYEIKEFMPGDDKPQTPQEMQNLLGAILSGYRKEH